VVAGSRARLEYESGVVVEGRVERIERRDGKLALVTFAECRVTWGDEVLFRPDWGSFDLAVGERIASVFSGAADQDAYEQQAAPVSRQRTIKHVYDARVLALHEWYAKVRQVREGEAGFDSLSEIAAAVSREHPDDWLLPLEILEVLVQRNALPELLAVLRARLEALGRDPGVAGLVGDGLGLVHAAGASSFAR
ncbi:MAG: phenylalanine 4-monooxygenase, partial [Deltaproteobacteria bacterium]|nr:phenylalanine 4-monooxygenase [Deltaproteobacteria bacterium]